MPPQFLDRRQWQALLPVTPDPDFSVVPLAIFPVSAHIFRKSSLYRFLRSQKNPCPEFRVHLQMPLLLYRYTLRLPVTILVHFISSLIHPSHCVKIRGHCFDQALLSATKAPSGIASHCSSAVLMSFNVTAYRGLSFNCRVMSSTTNEKIRSWTSYFSDRSFPFAKCPRKSM